MSTTMKWLLLGASDIASSRVIPAMRNQGDETVAVYSRSSERALAFATANEITNSTDSLDDAVTRFGATAAYVSSLNELHFEHARAALTAGLHVLCEKPLTLSIEESEELAALAASNGLILAVNHHLPGSALHTGVRQLVADGAIGEVLSARIAHAVSLPERLRGWRVGGDSPGAGVILDITCHDASVLNPLLGTPVRVSALGVVQAEWNTGTSPDAVMVTIEYRGLHGKPALAQTHDAFTVANESTRLIVHGTEGVITVDEAMTQEADGTITVVTADGSRVVDVQHRDLYAIVLEAFVSAIDGTGTPTATAADGINALRVALAAQESNATGTIITLADEDVLYEGTI